MAMLAEPKRKVKYGRDPRNSTWSNDKSKFGFRMLENMGWKEGKGLGANEDGMKDNVKTVFRMNNDVRGVGCSRDHADNWIAHQDDFNAILSSLNETLSKDATEKNQFDTVEASKTSISLVAKSKTSRSRVHYHKFTRGKDLSLRSAKDLDCIFGRRKGQISETLTPTLQSEANSDADEDGNSRLGASEDATSSSLDNIERLLKEDGASKNGLNFTTSSSSISEYFAKKMAELKRKQENGLPDSNDANLSIDLENNGDVVRNESSELAGVTENHHTQLRKKKKKDAVDNNQTCNELATECEKSPKKKKKSKKIRDDTVEGNVILDKSDVDMVHLTTEVSDAKRKKTKRKRSRDCCIEAPIDTLLKSPADSTDETPDSSLEASHLIKDDSNLLKESKYKKKNKKRKIEVVNENEEGTPLNSSILRCRNSSKSRMNKSVSFSMSDNEVFFISPIKRSEAATDSQQKDNTWENLLSDPDGETETGNHQNATPLKRRKLDNTGKIEDPLPQPKPGKSKKKKKKNSVRNAETLPKPEKQEKVQAKNGFRNDATEQKVSMGTKDSSSSFSSTSKKWVSTLVTQTKTVFLKQNNVHRLDEVIQNFKAKNVDFSTIRGYYLT